MRLVFITFFILSVSVSIKAQDIIYLKKNGAEIEVSIQEIDEEMIHYKKYGVKKGTIYSIPVTEVLKVRYEKGDFQYFEEVETGDENEEKENEPEIKVVEKADVQDEDEVSASSTEPIDLTGPIEEPVEKNKNKFKMKLGLGLMVGASFSTLQYQYDLEPIEAHNTYRFGPAGGLFIEWEIARFLSLRTSFYYKNKGDRTDGETYISNWQFPTDNPIVYTAEGNGYIDKHLGYFEWSILPLVGYTDRNNSYQIQLGAGVYAGYGLHGKEKVDLFIDYYRNGEFDEQEIINKTNSLVFVRELIVEEKLPETLYYNQIDYGFVFYIGAKPRPLNLGASLTWGKSNILSTSIEELFYSGEKIQTANNFSISVMFGYYL